MCKTVLVNRVFFSCACKTTVMCSWELLFISVFGFSNKTVRKGIQGQIPRCWNPFLDFPFYCKSWFENVNLNPNRKRPWYLFLFAVPIAELDTVVLTSSKITKFFRITYLDSLVRAIVKRLKKTKTHRISLAFLSIKNKSSLPCKMSKSFADKV